MLTALSDFEVIDLTHELHDKIPSWDGDSIFQASIDKDYQEVGCRIMSYKLSASSGTHMDAPTHFVPGSQSISELKVKNFVVPLSILRVPCAQNPDHFISVSDIKNYEKKYGIIPKGSLVIADTGWANYWNEPKRYRNLNEKNEMRFPGFSLEAAHFLLQREIVGLGIDTLSIDGSNINFPVHHLLLPKEKYFIENLANLVNVPERGAWAIALPLKIQGAAESPCRCVALVPVLSKQ